MRDGKGQVNHGPGSHAHSIPHNHSPSPTLTLIHPHSPPIQCDGTFTVKLNSMHPSLIHPHPLPLTPSQGDGTFTVKLKAHQAGLYRLRTRVAGSLWRNLSCRVRVTPGPIAPSMCAVYGPGLRHAYAGEFAKFTIEAR